MSRNEKEIKILTRWIDKKDVEPSKIPVFNFIDIVLYTKEHLLKEINERIEKGTNSEADLIDKHKLEDPSITHGVVKIIAMSERKETPIDPITMIRNH
jgi:predicted nucleic acid-binding protein